MSDFSGDNNINRIIALIIKSSETNQTNRYLTHLQKIAMSKYKSYIDMQKKKEEVREGEEEQEEEQEEEREEEREGEQEGEQEKVREGVREGEREGEQEKVREGEREKNTYKLNLFPCIVSYSLFKFEYILAYNDIIQLIIDNASNKADAETYIENLKRITINCNKYIDTTYKVLKVKRIIKLEQDPRKKIKRDLNITTGKTEGKRGGKRKSKNKSKKVSKKPVVSQKKQSIYKEIFGKQMKIYKMPDSRKEYVKYKGELLHISDYKDLMKQKAKAKAKEKVKSKTVQQKAMPKTKTKK